MRRNLGWHIGRSELARVARDLMIHGFCGCKFQTRVNIEIPFINLHDDFSRAGEVWLGGEVESMSCSTGSPLSMNGLEWINRITTDEITPADVISERLPIPDGSWLPVTQVKHFTLIFVVDKANGKVHTGEHQNHGRTNGGWPLDTSWV